MPKNNRLLALLSLLVMAAVLSTLVTTTPVRAQDGGGTGWGNFFDADGKLLPGVIQGGEVTQQASWMPTFPAWTGIKLDATYHQLVAPNGQTMLVPSTTTLFFMAMNPQASGLVNSNGQLGSGLGMGVELSLIHI